MRLLLLVTALVSVAVLVPSTWAGSAGTFKVTSTLDGRTALPHRLHWLARPSLPPAQIREVDFLIDGKVDQVEHKSPYVYGEDDEGRHLGYLVTSWLTPGLHRFAVRAIATGGRKATDTVVARVSPAPAPPALLAGTWERTISDTKSAPSPGSAGNPTETLTPPGRYTITFESRGIHDVFPCDTSPCRFNPNTGAGGEFLSDWTPGATTFEVRGEIKFRIFRDTDRLGGSWCYRDGPDATYTWTVSGDSLTLAPIGHDACTVRGFIWAGQWTRVH